MTGHDSRSVSFGAIIKAIDRYKNPKMATLAYNIAKAMEGLAQGEFFYQSRPFGIYVDAVNFATVVDTDYVYNKVIAYNLNDKNSVKKLGDYFNKLISFAAFKFTFDLDPRILQKEGL